MLVLVVVLVPASVDVPAVVSPDWVGPNPLALVDTNEVVVDVVVDVVVVAVVVIVDVVVVVVVVDVVVVIAARTCTGDALSSDADGWALSSQSSKSSVDTSKSSTLSATSLSAVGTVTRTSTVLPPAAPQSLACAAIAVMFQSSRGTDGRYSRYCSRSESVLNSAGPTPQNTSC